MPGLISVCTALPSMHCFMNSSLLHDDESQQQPLDIFPSFPVIVIPQVSDLKAPLARQLRVMTVSFSCWALIKVTVQTLVFPVSEEQKCFFVKLKYS